MSDFVLNTKNTVGIKYESNKKVTQEIKMELYAVEEPK